MMLSRVDDSAVPGPAVFMFVSGVPIMVNQNTHQGLKLGGRSRLARGAAPAPNGATKGASGRYQPPAQGARGDVRRRRK